MNKLLLLFTALTLSGCVTPPKPGSESVRIVGSDHNCEFIGTVTASGSTGWTYAQDAEKAINVARNKAYEMGANALRIDVDTSVFTVTAIGEALRCNDQN